MTFIGNIAATTELEAVNAMLAAIGESPVEELETTAQADVQMAVNILRDTTRDTLSDGWRFNTEYSVELAPTDTFEDPLDGTLLNIFTPPERLISFRAGPSVVLRPARRYRKDNKAPLVFYDRDRNRDGFPDLNVLVLHRATFYMDYDHLPESARNYIVKLATNRFVRSVVGSDTLAAFTERDIYAALRKLRRDQGGNDRHNLFRHPDFHEFLGGRI